MSKLVFILLSIFPLLTAQAQRNHTVTEYWGFENKYASISLNLDKSGRFLWKFNNHNDKGKLDGFYTRTGDTILLKDGGKTIKLLKREKNLFFYQNGKGEYSDFESLSKVSRKKYNRLISPDKKRGHNDDENNSGEDGVNKAFSDVGPFLETILKIIIKK